MGRYLLVLGSDLLALDAELDLEPINYLVELQAHEPCEVVVLSLVDTSHSKLPSLELALGGASSGMFAPAKFPAAPRPGHDVNAAAERQPSGDRPAPAATAATTPAADRYAASSTWP